MSMASSFTVFAPVALLLLEVILVGWQLLRQRRLKKHQDRLAALPWGVPFRRIALCRAQNKPNLWRIFAYEALGVVVDEGSHVRFVGRWPDAEQDFDIRLDKATCVPTWQGNKTLRDAALSWARFSTPSGDLLVSAGTGMRAWASREEMVDLLRGLYPNLALPQAALQDFALEKNRWSLAAILLFFLIGAFAFSETFNTYEWVGSQRAEWMQLTSVRLLAVLAPVGLLGLAHQLLKRGGVPARESFVLAMLLAFVSALAGVPSLKRIDQWTASAPAQWHRYRLVDSYGRLEPRDDMAGLPSLRQASIQEYWAQFDVGHELKVPLLHGGLGLWQLDHRLFDPPIDEFYEERAKRRDARH